MYTCNSIYLYPYINVCTYVHIYVYANIYIYIRKYVDMYKSLVHANIYIYIHLSRSVSLAYPLFLQIFITATLPHPQIRRNNLFFKITKAPTPLPPFFVRAIQKNRG